MKLSKKIKVKDDYTNVEITLKINTNSLTREESKKEFNKVLDRIAEALFKSYYFQDIKICK